MQATIDINLKVRRDTTAAWAAANPILADGELGYDKTLKKLKVGDGVTAWAGLAFLTDEVGAAAQSGGGGLSVYEKSISNVDFSKATNQTLSYPHGLAKPVSVHLFMKINVNFDGWLAGDLIPLNNGNIQASLSGGNVYIFIGQTTNFTFRSKVGSTSILNFNGSFDILVRVVGA